MRITTKCKIAVDDLLDIAAHTEKAYAISLPIMSKRLAVSHSYPELIFSSLKGAGLIHSHLGHGGGYSLAKNPEGITIKDIFDATDNLQPLLDGPGAQLWANLEAHMQNQMAEIMLSHILANTAIHIELNLECLEFRLEKTQKTKAAKVSAETKSSKVRHSLGPNSVFSFGKYLIQKK